MRLTVNGEAREREAGTAQTLTVEALFRIEAEESGIAGPQGIAIAVNGRVLRRRDWGQTSIREGDRIEIVRAMQGG